MTVAETGRTVAVRRLRPNQRGRAGGGHTRQEQQKQDSRARILEAAKKVLSERAYPLMAVEDVIAEAQVSRTTFYRHFESKFAIFSELHKPFIESLYKVYEGLGLCNDPSIEQICEWLSSFLDFYRSEKILVQAYQHIYSIEPDFYPVAEGLITNIFRRLAVNLSAFRKCLGDDEEAMTAKIEAHILLQDINYLGNEAVIRKWDLDTAKATQILARRIRHFITDYSSIVV